VRVALLLALFSGSSTLLAGIGTADAKTPKKLHWYTIERPTVAEPAAIGGYAGGCLTGAVALPKAGVGYETIRRWRNRFYGHPALTTFIAQYAASVKAADLPALLIGDLSQPRGGRMKSGHRSHQIGLDADIWFERPDERGSDDDFASLVRRKTETIDTKVFRPRHVKLLRMAAKSPAVSRVFVNWAIKRELCARVTEDRSWLTKVRPWYGHDRHFHVRLHCPDDSPGCVPQSAVPTADDCGVESWFSRTELRTRRKAAKAGKTAKAGKAAKAAKTRPARRKKPRSKAWIEPCARVYRAPAAPR
jgi:penicillin-insensitive murein endopeptidase